MTRDVPVAVAAAIAEEATQPVYLIWMDWDDTSSPERIAAWGQDIDWDSMTWAASGAEVRGLSVNGGELVLPNGEDDPWLALVMAQTPRGRAIDIYEYHVSDAVHIFSGLMDSANINHIQISIGLIEGLRTKKFPPGSINSTDFPHLLSGGDRLFWGIDTVLIE